MPPTFFTILAEDLMLSGAELLLTQHFSSAVLPVTWLTKFINTILESNKKKIVCRSQQVTQRNHLCHTKLIFMLSLTSSRLIGNEDKTIERKQTSDTHMYLPSVAWACWDHLKHWLICHAPASDLLWTAPLKPVLYLTHLQYRAFLLHRCLCQMSHPTVASGWHQRARHKPGGSTPTGRCILPRRPCICREPHLLIFHHWDLTEPCHTIYLSLVLQETKLGGNKTHQTHTHTHKNKQKKNQSQKPKQKTKKIRKENHQHPLWIGKYSLFYPVLPLFHFCTSSTA